jgi:uncharacterized protein
VKFQRRCLNAVATAAAILLFAAYAAPLSAQTAGGKPAKTAKKANDSPETGGVEAAIRAIEAREFPKALAILTPLSNAGDSEAQYLRGLLNESSVIPHASAANAASWYTKAAIGGNAKAQNNLGAMYYDGRGVARDLEQARTWYQRAAEQGNPQAQLNYALMLGQGLGGTDPEKDRDPAAMLRWLLLAADQDYPRAQVQLGKVYLSGRDFPADVAEAVYWFRLAAELNSTEAQYLLGQLLQKGEGVPRDLDAATRWFERAAAGEPSDAMAAASFELGVIYELGLGTAADDEKSRAYYRQSAAAGYAKAVEKLKSAK